MAEALDYVDAITKTMSWEDANKYLRTQLIESKLPETSAAAKQEIEGLQTAIEILQDRRTGPRSPQEAKFLLSQVSSQEQKCRKAIEQVQACPVRTDEEAQSKRRLLSSLSVALDEHMQSLQQDIMQDALQEPIQSALQRKNVSLQVETAIKGAAWEADFRTELLRDQLQIERSLSELKTLLSAAATTVQVQGENLDRLDININRTHKNMANALKQVEESDKQQDKAKLAVAACLVLVVIIVIVLVLVLAFRK